METSPTSPAIKAYYVHADCRVVQRVEASGPEEAYRISRRNPNGFDPCDPGIDGFVLLPAVTEEQSGESFRVAEPENGTLRQASQRFYDAVQDYVREPDSELLAELVEAMDALEAAWHEADGTLPESAHDDA